MNVAGQTSKDFVQFSLLSRILVWLRDLVHGAFLRELPLLVTGHVLDVGGSDFFFRSINGNQRITFTKWTSIDIAPIPTHHICPKNFEFIQGSAYAMPFKDNTFDTVINIQMLEHVFEPNRVVQEVARVLKINGRAIFVIPQTANLHMGPLHFYNFTPFWVLEVMKLNGLQIQKMQPLGGFWKSIASRFFYFFLQAFGAKGMTSGLYKKSHLFYLFLPFQCLVALIMIPLGLGLSLGDLPDEATNLMVVVIKSESQG